MPLRFLSLSFIILTIVFSVNGYAGPSSLAFDGAMGFGKYTQGGNSGKVVVVSSLDDNAVNPQEGTLRWAVKQPYPRLVVFAVSGVIQLEKTLEIKASNITIAGQTSPEGIVIAGASTSIEADQVIIRHLAFRPGHFMQEGDALSARNQSDIIIDHCSLSWANDEVGSFYNNTRFTLQYSLLAESLNNAGHHKGRHGYGGIWGGRKASFLRNVLVSHISRNPRLNGWRLKSPYPQGEEFIDMRNNIIANWQDASGYGGEGGKANVVANYFAPGPATKSARFFELWSDDRPLTRLYIQDNVMRDKAAMSNDNRQGVKVKGEKKQSEHAVSLKQKSLATQPFEVDALATLNERTLSAEEAWKLLIEQADVGRNRMRARTQHDSVDTRILQQIQNNTFPVKNGIVDSEMEVVDWSAYRNEFSSNEESASRLSEDAWRELALL